MLELLLYPLLALLPLLGELYELLPLALLPVTSPPSFCTRIPDEMAFWRLLRDLRFDIPVESAPFVALLALVLLLPVVVCAPTIELSPKHSAAATPSAYVVLLMGCISPPLLFADSSALATA